MEHESKRFILPVSIVGPTDIARLLRELDAVSLFFKESEIRQPGTQQAMPRLSKLMDQLVTDNQLNLLKEQDRVQIQELLTRLSKDAPVLHMSFSVDPPGPYVQKIVSWLREHIHAYALVTVGLQPNIGAGCIVRTTNKIFDFSLREFFSQKREFFIEKLHEAITNESQSVITEAVEQQQAAQAVQVAPTIPTPVAVQPEGVSS